jgi:predicted DCC family thiol-disulfide oxidoreductase YuxK
MAEARDSRVFVLYDGHCPLCQRAVAVGSALDWLGRVEWIDAHQREKVNAIGAGQLSDDQLLTDIHAKQADKIARGYDAYRMIARQLPLCWPGSLLMRLPPVAWVGKRLYRRIADHRYCSDQSACR